MGMRLPCAKQLPGWKPPFLKTVKIWPLHQKKTLLVFSLQSVKDCFYLTSSLPLPYYLLPPFSSTWNSFLTWVGFERSSNITHCFRATLKWHFRTMDSRPHLFSISSSPSAPKDMPLSEHPHVTSTHFEKIRKKKKRKKSLLTFSSTTTSLLVWDDKRENPGQELREEEISSICSGNNERIWLRYQ